MYITQKHIPRRTFLRGAGVTLALPFLESMLPAQAPAAGAKTRFVGIWSPHGWAPTYWNGTMAGANTSVKGQDFKLGSIHTPLEPFRDKLVIFGGLDATSSMPPPGRAAETIHAGQHF